MSSLKQSQPFNKRKEYADRMLKKYPDRIPVIIERRDTSGTKKILINKYVVPHVFTVAQFITTLRAKIELSSDQSIFLYSGKILPSTSDTMGGVYDKCKEADGFLYMTLSPENTFG